MNDDKRREVCVNCTAFKFKQGATNTWETQLGECRASVPKAGGTKWANVKGPDWCRDGFKANSKLVMEKAREAKMKKAGSVSAEAS